MTFRQQLAYRAKAILTALAVAVVGLVEWAVSNPDTAAAVRQFIPDPYDQLVPVVLGGIGVLLVHGVPNRAPDPGTALETSATEPVTEGAPATELTDDPATTAIRTVDPDAY